MSTFAQVGMSPVGPALWLVVGLLAGLFAGLVLRGGTGGIGPDVGAGVAGAVMGGAVAALIVPGDWGGVVGSIAGACGLLVAMRELAPRSPRA